MSRLHRSLLRAACVSASALVGMADGSSLKGWGHQGHCETIGCRQGSQETLSASVGVLTQRQRLLLRHYGQELKQNEPLSGNEVPSLSPSPPARPPLGSFCPPLALLCPRLQPALCAPHSCAPRDSAILTRIAPANRSVSGIATSSYCVTASWRHLLCLWAGPRLPHGATAMLH